MRIYWLMAICLAISVGCKDKSEREDSAADQSESQPQDSTSAKDQAESSSQTPAEIPDVPSVHFFSVAWGCVNVEKEDLDSEGYEIKDYKIEDGTCPKTLKVANEESKPMFTCKVKINDKIDALYVLYDKRTLDGSTVNDLRAEGFTKENFCPIIGSKQFKLR